MSIKLLIVGAVVTVIAVETGGLNRATEQSLMHSASTLSLLEPQVSSATGETALKARRLVKEARVAIEQAEARLEEKRPFAALDLALQASSRAGNLREQFERR